ncbi:MAG: aminopeptidase [Myxococcales bacterium]|jgi:aminopeptidase|nr:aminopeptidase [Myxococcales bacterium]
MHDSRMTTLARSLVRYSCQVQADDNVLVEATDIPDEMVALLVREIREAGARPFVTLKHNRVLRELYACGTTESLELTGLFERARMENMQAYIGLRGTLNLAELSDVPPAQMALYQKHWLKPVHMEVRVPKTRWVVLRWPSPSMAQQAGKSTDAFEDFYFDVCNLDYGRMSRAMDPLVELMERTDRVRLIGPGTDLRFSIRGLPAIKCDGRMNIPDGEIFTAPVRDSVNGTIRYNTASLYQGTRFEDLAFTFKDGKIVEAVGKPADRLAQILDSDEGARYVGEFAIGVNPFITAPMLDTLFDEKIAGSIHFTPGNAYDECDNGNRSAVHWDLVLIQTEAMGGGELWFDDVLVRKDGRFVLDALQGLNPENLKS